MAHQFSAVAAAVDDDQLDECESKYASLMLFTIDLYAKWMFYYILFFLCEQKRKKLASNKKNAKKTHNLHTNRYHIAKCRILVCFCFVIVAGYCNYSERK